MSTKHQGTFKWHKNEQLCGKKVSLNYPLRFKAKQTFWDIFTLSQIAFIVHKTLLPPKKAKRNNIVLLLTWRYWLYHENAEQSKCNRVGHTQINTSIALLCFMSIPSLFIAFVRQNCQLWRGTHQTPQITINEISTVILLFN